MSRKVFIIVLTVVFFFSQFLSFNKAYAAEEILPVQNNDKQTNANEVSSQQETTSNDTSNLQETEPVATEEQPNNTSQQQTETIKNEPTTETTTTENPQNTEASTPLGAEQTQVKQESDSPYEKEEAQPDNSTNTDTKVHPTSDEEQKETVNMEEVNYQSLPQLLITEISPNSKGSDYYEFFEVYNNTNQTLDISRFSFYYQYTDVNTADKLISMPEGSIEPGQTKVFWFNTNSLALDSFNQHYGTSLTEQQVISFKEGFPGFANGGNRGILVRDIQENEVVSASYGPGESDNNGLGIDYRYPITGIHMDAFQTLALPTPGSITNEQVPEKTVELEPIVVDSEAPVISHQAVTHATKGESIQIQAVITDNLTNPSAKLYYKEEGTEEYSTLSFEKDQTNVNQYVVEISNELIQSNIMYYIEATDGLNTVKTEEYKIQVEEEIKQDTYSNLPILITEISPNSVGGGTDYYEYFEVYNNTNQDMNLGNYAFYYRYTDNSREDIHFQVPATTIPAGESMVFWFNNGSRTLADFNDQFSSNLTNEQVVSFTDSFPGFANGGNRAIVIKDIAGTETVKASYLGSENDNNGKVIHYMFPDEGTEMKKYEVLANPSPGVMNEEQVPTKWIEVPEAPKDEEAPAISHEKISTADAFQEIKVDATIKDNIISNPFATLFYKVEGEENYQSLTMSKLDAQENIFSATIPASDTKAQISYYIEASDGLNVSKTEIFTINISTSDVDYEKIPKLLVTEVVPDSSNIGPSDGYEFIEIYNNTDKPINFKDYKIQYRYGTDPASDVIWPSIPDDVEIPAQGTLVFWIINAANGEATVEDFNTHYGTSLKENQDIVRIKSDGMANGSTRGLVIATNTKEEISVAYYNEVTGQDDTVENKGILYKYPEDGSTQSVKISAGVNQATPGSVESIQVPKEPIHIIEDSNPPTITNHTIINVINERENITISAKATDDLGVKSVTLYYRTNGEEDFKQVLLAVDPSDKEIYSTTIYAAEFIAKEKMEYYFVASDGQNEVRTDIATLVISNSLNQDPIRLNVKDNDILSGKVIVKGTSQETSTDTVNLFIDNKILNTDVYSSLESQAYFIVDISGFNMYFKNAVTMGEEIIQLMDKDNHSDWRTYTIPIDADKLVLGENTLTVRAGNKASPFQLEESEENRDDYSIRNVRLILADGTVIKDPAKSNPSTVYDMGDDGTYRPFEDFTFTLTEDHTKAKTYHWDSSTVADGEHTITAKNSEQEVSATVLVDNTAPVIETNMENGSLMKGTFTIQASATDALAGMESIETFLDDQEIQVPYESSSSQLSAGEHKLSIVAKDKAGNTAESIIVFSVNNENPEKPELVSPTDDVTSAVEGDPTLKVRVKDPSNDSLDVTFYKGYKYEASNKSSVQAYENASDTEPPQVMVPEGETALTDQGIDLVSQKDGNYLTTNSTTQFPYHRFDVTLDTSIDENDRVELVWNGKSLEGRKVSMYAWSHTENKWKLLTYKIAGAQDFELKAEVTPKEFAKESKINVLIQDEIPASPEEYDYTFVWMSDTQYYSESYPHIYQRQTEWIAEKQEELKIKYVFHTGDVVDEFDKEQQWIYADEYMKVLEDNNVPYGVLAGNHDVDQLSNDYTQFSKWFGANRFEDKAHYGESYKDNRGHYDLISAGGNDFIMIYMGWGVNDEDMQWINDVLEQYPDRKAILNFHEYLLVSGNRSPIGEEIFSKVVEKNENVLLVLSGHYHDSETLVSEIDDNQDGVTDRKVYQMLGDYQGGPEGGQGYMKLMHFDQDNNRIIINTYSPYLDDYNFYDPAEYPLKDELVIDMDLEVKEKQVATDYFAVNVFTDEEIGKQEGVSSGDIAEVEWKGLEENKQYSWYAVAEDAYTGKANSDIWTFVKGATSVEPTPETPNEGDGDTNPDTPGEEENPTPELPNENDHEEDLGDSITPDQQHNSGQTVDSSQSSTNNADIVPIKQGDKATILTQKLPNTATSQFNMLLMGMLLLLAGTLIIIFVRKKSHANN